MRKKWQENRSPSTETELNKAIKEVREALNNKHQNETKHYLQSLSASKHFDYSLWKATKENPSY